MARKHLARIAPRTRHQLRVLDQRAAAVAQEIAALGAAGEALAASLARSPNPLDRRIAADVRRLTNPRAPRTPAA